MTRRSPSSFRLEILVAVLASVGTAWMARTATTTDAEMTSLVGRFGFAATELPLPSGAEPRTIRAVNPSLAHIDAWISSVGSAAALGDFDGDGLSDDLCLVEPRTDQVLIMEIPTTATPEIVAVLEPSGIDYDQNTMAPMGCVPHDVDEDGIQEFVVYYWGRPPIVFTRQGSRYEPRDALAEVGETRMFSNAMTFADIDGDGHYDLVLGNYFADGARILDTESDEPQSMQHSMSRAFNGGRNIVASWHRGRDGKPSYQIVEGVLGDEAERGWTLAVAAADFDGDMRPELYFANDFGPDRIFHNASVPGRIVLEPVWGADGPSVPSSLVMGRDSFKGMGVDVGDVDGDGRLDVYVSNITHEYALEESHFLFLQTEDQDAWTRGEAPFVERSDSEGVARSGWGWDSKIADFDNDGRPELLQATGFVKGEVNRWAELQELAMANDELLARPSSWPKFGPGDDLCGDDPNSFFVYDGERHVDIALALGVGGPGVSRGLATADVDLDGDLDFVSSNQWAPSILYRNQCAEGGTAIACGKSLGLRLRLPIEAADGFQVTALTPQQSTSGRASRPAIGAAVTVHRADGRVLVGQVDGGNGHSGVRSPELLFGLGSDDQAASVTVEYRDSQGQGRRVELELDAGWYEILLPTKREPEQGSSR